MAGETEGHEQSQPTERRTDVGQAWGRDGEQKKAQEQRWSQETLEKGHVSVARVDEKLPECREVHGIDDLTRRAQHIGVSRQHKAEGPQQCPTADALPHAGGKLHDLWGIQDAPEPQPKNWATQNEAERHKMYSSQHSIHAELGRRGGIVGKHKAALGAMGINGQYGPLHQVAPWFERLRETHAHLAHCTRSREPALVNARPGLRRCQWQSSIVTRKISIRLKFRSIGSLNQHRTSRGGCVTTAPAAGTDRTRKYALR